MELQHLQTENIEMQYKQLKGQINPHFLFNSLNILVSLIYKDAERAAEYTKKLSEVYRYVLTYDTEYTVTVAQEADFISNYIDILKIRFHNALQITTHLSGDAANRKIIPMTLQILIENATKHNIVSESKPLKIRIDADNVFITVSNTLSPRYKVAPSTGIGLKNLSQKYKFIAGKDILVTKINGQFTVKIPLL